MPKLNDEPKINVIPSENRPPDSRIKKMKYKHCMPSRNYLILGRAGSGKSSFLYTLLTDVFVYGKNKKSVFDEMIILLGTQDSVSSFQSIKCKNKVILHEFDADDFEEYLEDLKKHQMDKIESGKPALNICLVADDFVGEALLKPSKNGKAPIIQRVMLTARHELNMTVLLCSQIYKSNGLTNAGLRNNIHYYIVYALSRNDLEKFVDENCGFYQKDELIEHYMRIFQKPHNYGIVNYTKPEHLRYTEGFTKLLPPPRSMEKSLVFKRDDDESSLSSSDTENVNVK